MWCELCITMLRRRNFFKEDLRCHLLQMEKKKFWGLDFSLLNLFKKLYVNIISNTNIYAKKLWDLLVFPYSLQ